MVDILKVPKPKLTYNQYVKLVEGFYKGWKGTIKAFDIKKDKVFYDVELEIDGETITKNIEERELKTAYKSSLSNLFG